MARLTKLTKPLRRKIDGRVIEIHREGVRVRRQGQRRALLVSWEELERAFPPPARTRQEAFSRERPAAWLPAAGDPVWLKKIPYSLGNAVASGIVERVTDCTGGPLVRVMIRHGDKTHSEQWLLDNVRPK